MEESKSKNMRHVVKGLALLLCVFFFIMPLVKCSQDSSINASGWEISSGSGNLFDSGSNSGFPMGDMFDNESSNSGFPLAFMLLIIPAILLVMGFTSTTFIALRNVSIAGLVAQVIFMISAHIKLNQGDLKGAFELTGNNWLIVFIYFGLIGLMLYCIGQEKIKEGEVNDKIDQSHTQGKFQ